MCDPFFTKCNVHDKPTFKNLRYGHNFALSDLNNLRNNLLI